MRRRFLPVFLSCGAAVTGLATIGVGRVAAQTTAPAATTLARAVAAVVDVNTKLGYQNAAAAGTGMVLSASGYVLTNNHVIRGATTIRVRVVGNGRTYRASVVGYDVAADVAVLKLRGAARLTTAPIAHPSTLKVGASVTAVGNAGGAGGAPSRAGGTVTALSAAIVASDQAAGTSERLTHLIESNTALEPGDSGGPLLDAAGRVVAMNTAASNAFQIASNSGRGFSIPIARALAIANRIRAGRFSTSVHPGATAFLGVQLTASSYVSGGRFVTKLLVAGVVPASPAQSAGIAYGTALTTLNGGPITSSSSLTSALLALAPGTSIQLGWADASGATHISTVVLASGPPQ